VSLSTEGVTKGRTEGRGEWFCGHYKHSVSTKKEDGVTPIPPSSNDEEKRKKEEERHYERHREKKHPYEKNAETNLGKHDIYFNAKCEGKKGTVIQKNGTPRTSKKWGPKE